ncbi:MAG: hypothetical protein ISS18_06280 [Bacteroidales bacterium]|nr:hypothetical protein [Bacteroidales bacterium]
MESKSCPATEKFFVLDDTITEVTGKLIECASYIYDHTIRKSVLGFQKLVLGIYTSDRFIPISQRICVGKKRPNKKSKARKYTKIPKSDKIHPESAGAKEREELDKNKLEKSYSLLKEAKKKIKDVNYVLCILVPKVFGMVFLWHFLFLLLFRPNSNMLFLFGLSGAFSIAQIRKSSWRREPRISNRFSIINRK